MSRRGATTVAALADSVVWAHNLLKVDGDNSQAKAVCLQNCLLRCACGIKSVAGARHSVASEPPSVRWVVVGHALTTPFSFDRAPNRTSDGSLESL